MALIHANSTVGTTATLLVTVLTSARNPVAVQIQNLDAAAVFVGDSTITTSGATRGHSIAANGTFQLWLSPGDKIFGISASGTTAGAVVITYSA